MKKRLLWLLGGMFIFLQVSVGAALAYDVTGTIHNGTSNSTKRIYVVVMMSGETNSTGYGTSIASIPAGGSTAFTVRGVPNGSYYVAAFMDLSDTGSLHLYDPSVASGSFDISNANPPNLGTLNLPAINNSPPAPPAPDPNKLNVVPTSNGALVMWNGSQSPVGGSGPNAEIADSYVIYWGTSPNPSNPAQSKTVPASGDYHVFVSPLTQGTSVYFAVKAVNRGGSATTATPGSFLIQGGTTGPGTATVSGRVYSTGITKPAGAPLSIVLIPNNGVPYITVIPGPIPDSAPWSIAGVAPGTYNIYVILDLNNDGFSNVAGYATGRGVNDGYHNSPSVTVPSGVSAATAPDVTVTAPNSGTIVTTSNQNNSWYQLQFKVTPMLKRPVSVTINNSGPNMSGAPIDLGIAVGNNGGGNASRYGDNSGPQVSFSARPSVGDTYSVTVGYSDGSSETLHPQVTGVVTALPTMTFPSGTTTAITNPAPFAWLTPGLLAGYYDFSLYLSTNGPFYNRIWAPQENGNGGGMPSTQLSIPYNSDNSASQSSLDPGTTYNWSLNVNDGFGNQGFGSATFTPQAGGPVISGFTPTSGAVGSTPVTINGSGFTGATAVKFGGFLAIPFTVVNDGQITTTVPAAASVGPITVTNASGVTTASSTSFQPTISFKGGVVDSSGTTAISGATVTLVNSNPVVSVTTNPPGPGAGDFNITVPAGVPYSLLIHKAGYIDTLTATMSNPMNQDSSSTSTNPSPYKLYLSDGSELPSGVSGTMATKGLIYTRLREWDKTSANLDFSGATVTATSFLHPGIPYTVQYPSGSSTGSDGVFYVQNVDEGDTVGVTATLPGYFTVPRTYTTHTGVVSTGKVNATPVPVTTATPSGGTTSLPISLALSNTVGWESYNVWYTTDGTDPTFSGGTRMLYGSAIALSPGSRTLKFYAVNTTHNVPGSVTTATYNVITVPGAPTDVTAVSGNGQATVSFTPPVSDGGSAITSYTVTSSPSNISASGSASPIVVGGLTNNTSYTFTVTATNAAGVGPASSPASNSVTPNPILTVTINGTGTGSINSVPSGIACTSGSPAGCSSFFGGSPSVSLNPSPDWKSILGSWSGDCTGSGACSVLMNANRSVTATFNLNMQAELMPAGTPFASLQDAYNAATVVNNSIKAQVYTFQEIVALTSPLAVTLDGGKDSGYSATIGMTTLHGALTVGLGSLTLSNLTVQ